MLVFSRRLAQRSNVSFTHSDNRAMVTDTFVTGLFPAFVFSEVLVAMITKRLFVGRGTRMNCHTEAETEQVWSTAVRMPCDGKFC